MSRCTLVVLVLVLAAPCFGQENPLFVKFEAAIARLTSQAEAQQREIEKVFAREAEKIRQDFAAKLAVSRNAATKRGDLDKALAIKALEEKLASEDLTLGDAKASNRRYTAKAAVGTWKWFNGTTLVMLPKGSWKHDGRSGEWYFEEKTQSLVMKNPNGTTAFTMKLKANGDFLTDEAYDSGRGGGHWGVKVKNP